jgi:alpha-D-ribose 1-methylphosphonate 5-triphosphate synthase subunit PhnL
VVGGYPGLLLDGPADEVHGTFPVAALETRETQKVQGVGVPGILLDDAISRS